MQIGTQWTASNWNEDGVSRQRGQIEARAFTTYTDFCVMLHHFSHT